jgi:transcription antitermination protein NusB
MLNRRTLRIKTMQSIYAFIQARQSDFHAAQDLISDTFAPDLNSPEVQDKAGLEAKKKQALELFSAAFPEGKFVEKEGTPQEVRAAVLDALNYYHNLVKKDQELYERQMVSEAEGIYDTYLRVLLLLIELSDAVLHEEDEKMSRHIKPMPASPEELRFAHNPLIETLRNSEKLQREFIRKDISWNEERGFVKSLYRDVLIKDEKYIAYQQQPEPGFEAHEQIVNYIIRQIILKEDTSTQQFEEVDIKWSENKDVVKSMVSKTMKSVTEEGGEPELAPLSPNWEDDKAFFIDLYRSTLKDDLKWEELISGKVKNWDFERIAAIDKIILKMAISEMFNFASIPVKVTINEYIDISKQYSTPKSKQFVNGLLDVIAAGLTETGAIRKSGRGLIDNK